MAIVLDANLLVALAVDDDRAPAVTDLLQRWLATGEELHAPALLPYEVASGLTRLAAGGYFAVERLPEAWREIMAIPITYHALQEQGNQVIDIALRLRRQSAYDAAYISLTQQVEAELWTFDGPLARNAAALGFPVHLIR